MNDTNSLEFDLVVAGSGAGGLATAVVAARAGLKVLVVEKTAFFGGTTAYSGGVVWIPVNDYMSIAGVSDSCEQALDYLKNLLGEHYDSAKAQAFVENGRKMARFMAAKTEVEFTPVPIPDYEQQYTGANRYRGLLAREYDGRALGEFLFAVRPPRPELTIFDSMQVAAADIIPLRKAFRTLGGFGHTARMVARYAWQKMRYGRGTRLVNGNALVGRLLRSALDAGVTLWPNTPAREIIMTDGRATGLVIEREGRTVAARATCGVVIATGGFGSNPEMRREFIPFAEHHVSLQPEGNTGDGIRMGEAIGGRLVRTNAANAIFAPISISHRPNGETAKFPHIMIDRYMPGSIVVDENANRFVNEAGSYQKFVMRMHQLGLTKCYLIANRRFLRKYGMGLARPMPYPVRPWVRAGYLAEAPTIEELATKIDVDPVALRKTVDRFSEFAAKGEDPDFQRGADVHSRYRGDQENTPNPSLAPIGEGPYYALTLKPGDLGTVAGLETDAKARVISESGAAIPGLYAVGLDMNSMTCGFYPGAGGGLGSALTFGYIAGCDVVACFGAAR